MSSLGWTRSEAAAKTAPITPASPMMEGSMKVWSAMLATAPAASGVDTSTNEAWAARAQEKIEAMEAATGGEDDMCPSTTPHPSADAVRELVKRAYEVVHHDDECPAIGGCGDKDCRCDAVPFLRELESLLSGGSNA